MAAIPGTDTGSCTLWSSPSTSYSFTEYLMLDDGECLNSLLPVDFIPSNSNHLFWDKSIDSFRVPWDLQPSMAGSLVIDSFGNKSMSPDQWILSSVQPQHIYSHLLDCTLVPWFPFSLSMGDLMSVNGIHQWLVIRRWTTMFNLDTSIHIVGLVLIVVCVEGLPDWWHLLYATSLDRASVHEILSLVIWFQCMSGIFSHYGDLDPLYIFSFMEILVVCISSSWSFWSIYIVRGDDHTFHIVYHAYSWPLYSYVSGTVVCTCSHM